MSKSLTLAAVLILAACGTSGTATKAMESGTPRPSRDLITREQIESNSATDVFDLVQRLRPDALRERGASSMTQGRATPIVYIDGVRRGSTEVLRGLRTSDVEEIRFVSATDATTRWGTDHAAGAIDIKMRHGR
ncbi:MAG TPA: hypothetical protein VK864_10960 [Longimicrobiales bacterium]|nr:hypothetical protein [Longimicrobiales bacterium]